jgi:hypothetical protein
MFEGVEFVSLPRFMHGVRLEEGGVEDAARLDALVDDRLRSLLNLTPTNIFVLISANRRHLVVAGRCWVREHEGESHQDPFVRGGTAWIQPP